MVGPKVLVVACSSLLLGAVIGEGPEQAYFLKDGRHFVSEHAMGGGMGEAFVQASITDLWTGEEREVEGASRRMFNCSLGGAPHGDGDEETFDRDEAARHVRECEEGNASSEAAFDDAMAPHRRTEAPGILSLASPSKRAKFEIGVPAGQPPVQVEPRNPLLVSGGKGATYFLQLALPGRPVRELTGRFHFGEDRRNEIWILWSADEQWVAYVPPGSLHASLYPAIARVDVLDAGAGKKLTELVKKLEAAGYAPSHQGKAKTPRATSEIFVKKGFEEDGKLVAKALGLPEGAVKPLTWPSPYAVTIAAGSE